MPVLPSLAPLSWARAGPRNCRRGRCSAFPPATRAQCSRGGGVSAASRSGVGSRPPCPRLGPVPRSRGPFPAQGPAAAAGRAPRGGRAGVFNGSMLPAAGAAPGQAGPPARPQSPRSHQLQLQLCALLLPQSPAAFTGNRRRRQGHTLGGFSLCFPLPTRLHLRDTLIPRGSPRPSIAHCLGLSRLPLRFESLCFLPGAVRSLSPASLRGSSESPSDPP